MHARTMLRLFLLASASGLAFAVSGADAARRVTGVEPGPEHLAPVDPAWKAAGWRAVVPHAYVVTKLLAVRVAPDPKADIAYHLKGGVRVPVLEQQRDWWKIQWTDGRHGWAPASDLLSRSTVLLLDASTGAVRRRLAMKGQWGFLAEGERLWSFANTGLTRTELTDPPQFWAYPVTREVEGNLPYDGLLSADRRTLFFPARENGRWQIGRVDTHGGRVRLIAAPRGRLAGVPSKGAALILRRTTATTIVEVATAKPRSIAGDLLAVGNDGSLYLKRGRTLLRTDTTGRIQARMQLPKGFRNATLTADRKSLAICYDANPGGSNVRPHDTRLRLLDLQTLRKVAGLVALSEDGDEVVEVLSGPQGWFVVSFGGGTMSTLTRYDTKGKETGQWDATAGCAFDTSRGMAYPAGENNLASVPLGSGKVRKWSLPWRRELPDGLLPPDPRTGVPVRQEISHITLSPDRRTLIVTERLAGDVAA